MIAGMAAVLGAFSYSVGLTAADAGPVLGGFLIGTASLGPLFMYFKPASLEKAAKRATREVDGDSN
jgi:hypothetical protein